MVIFPSRVSLFADQLLRMLCSLFIFAVKFVFKYASLDVENHIPKAYTLSFAHRIGLEDEIALSEFLYGPIQRASVFS